jgi:hypothetical protein
MGGSPTLGGRGKGGQPGLGGEGSDVARGAEIGDRQPRALPTQPAPPPNATGAAAGSRPQALRAVGGEGISPQP